MQVTKDGLLLPCLWIECRKCGVVFDEEQAELKDDKATLGDILCRLIEIRDDLLEFSFGTDVVGDLDWTIGVVMDHYKASIFGSDADELQV